jgi:hypothetical protein
MKTYPPQTLGAPGCTSSEETWLYTDGESVQAFALPGAIAAVLVKHPPAASAPPGVDLHKELLSFGRHFFRVPPGPT